MSEPANVRASLRRLLCCGLAGAAAACSGPAPTLQPAALAVQRQTSDAKRATPNPPPFLGLPRLAPPVRPLPVATVRRRPLATIGSTFAYVSDYGQDTVTAFSPSGVQTAQIGYADGLTDPQGLATDTKGNLYIADTSGGVISEWSPGLGSQLATYRIVSPASYLPVDVAVDDANALVGVTNFPGGNETFLGSVMIFQEGSTSPCVTLTDPNWHAFYFAAFDDAGNLYVDGLTQNGTTLVGVVSGGCAATAITTLTGTKITFPGGIAVAANDDISIDDQGDYNGSTVYRYAPPVNGAFGKPLKKTPLVGSFDAAGIALAASGRDLWYADTNSLTNRNVLDEIAYPKGGAPLQSLAPSSANGYAQLVIGAAVAPGARP